jgi:hypothetical protein
MLKETIQSPLGPVPTISFIIGGVKEVENSKYGTSQLIFPEKGDEGFVKLNNQKEIYAGEAGTTVLFIASPKEYQGKTELSGIELVESAKGNRYFKVGKAAQMYVGDEISNAPEAPAPMDNPQPTQRNSSAPPRAAAAKPTVNNSSSMEELIEYGLSAINIGLEVNGNLPGEVLASIYGSAMFGFKEGRPLRKDVARPDDKVLEQKATEMFASDDDDGDEIPF